MELIPLNPDQHVVTFIPKLSAELPFFNLTRYKHNLADPIKFEGLDTAGHPIHWEVFPNASKEIGAPGVEAHRVWYLLIKPAIDETRQQDGKIPQIVPLGKVRECLRKIGWTAGGRQEKELIKSLTQISFAGCVADLWVPTKELDENGRPKYIQVKGRFSRLSVYSIGEHHFTEEELKNASFDFDPEDVIYIKLDPLEAKIQEAQDQRIFDNEYLFSVSPAARRWYELLAPKIFGSVKNKAPFCEIKYSWYIKHHHTLKRFYERREVVKQMQGIVKDHIAANYISKVEYRKIKEPDQEIDYIIRYYPGEGAKESIARIQGHLYRKRKQLKDAPASPEAETSSRITESAGQGSEALTSERETTVVLDLITAEESENQQMINELVSQFRIKPLKALELVKNYREATRQQLQYFPHRGVKLNNPAGWLIAAIEANYNAPEGFLEAKAKEDQERREKAITEAIVACSYCHETKGWRRVVNERYPEGAMRKCSHDPAIESQFTN